MHTVRECLTIAAMGLAAGSAWAADVQESSSVGRWYVAPQLGATVTDHDRSVDNGVFYGLALGKHLSEDWSAELDVLSGNQGGRRGAPDQRITAVSADVLRVFDRNAAFSPFLTAGIGVITDDPGAGSSSTGFMGQAGVGGLIHVWDSASGSTQFSLRPQVKWRWDGNRIYGEHPLDTLIGLGFELSFGALRSIQATAAPPAPQAAAALPPVLPGKPAVLDSDGDGVPDDRDQCPNTPHATAVDALGCPLKGSITLVGVHFENDSAKLTPESFTVLDPLAASLKAHPRLKIELQGHTDAVGSAPYNLKLSQARAEAVREYLVAQGVSASTLTAKGYGKTQPVADNKTAAGRAENRRVVMSVLENPGDVEVKQSAGAP